MRDMSRRLQSLIASAVAAVCLWSAVLLVLNRPPDASLASMLIGVGLLVFLGLTTARVAVSLWNGPPEPPT